MSRIEYFFTPVSPWAYMGHQRFVALSKKYQVKIVLRPFELGTKIFPISGGLPIAQRPAQRLAYRLAELKRWGAYLKLPINIKPAFFPVSDLLALKTIVAVQQLAGDDIALAITGDIMRAVWEQEKNVADIEVLNGIGQARGLNITQISTLRETAQASLDTNNNAAIDANVFGAPWFELHTSDSIGKTQVEPFWGQDRLDFLERALAQSK
jgi:2-hydroxychromene-2-carboxylate isomerase